MAKVSTITAATRANSFNVPITVQGGRGGRGRGRERERERERRGREERERGEGGYWGENRVWEERESKEERKRKEREVGILSRGDGREMFGQGSAIIETQRRGRSLSWLPSPSHETAARVSYCHSAMVIPALTSRTSGSAPAMSSTSQRADFVVVGGGISGVTCCQELSQIAGDVSLPPALSTPRDLASSQSKIALVAGCGLLKGASNVVKLSRHLNVFDIVEQPLDSLTNTNTMVLSSKARELDVQNKRVLLSDGDAQKEEEEEVVRMVTGGDGGGGVDEEEEEEEEKD
eukprot:746286-Hanusia_phi.AAC.1